MQKKIFKAIYRFMKEKSVVISSKAPIPIFPIEDIDLRQEQQTRKTILVADGGYNML